MKKLLIFCIALNLNLIAQETEEIPIDELRNNEINDLLEIVKKNRSIYVNEDNRRLQIFLDKIEERTKLLNDAKKKLADENLRNERLEAQFENNEKELADLEEKLQIKIGVLGELFGVARQFAGELAAASENSVVFYEFPQRSDRLKQVSKIQVHNLEELEDLWLAYFDEIVAGSEIKNIKASVTDPDGESFDASITRYGLFSASYGNKFVTPASSLNSFKLLAKQPESSITRTLSKHSSSDDYTKVAIDPTRGFLLSLYLDKPGWFQRIAQGKLIGFIIISIGFIGLAFSVFKIYRLRGYVAEVENDSSGVIAEMSKSVESISSRESKENVVDEIIINYTGTIEWGSNWIKFFAAVAPLLGLLGTVIGMIETFQAITLFGTGDPKQMAGGISQALVTTMLGLIVAAPLLGMYTYISEKTSSVVQILEEKASYILSKS
tara:strand:- start:749 stop:2062 length:1314 start_codon:yes stop_codon:yes gene_type:complete